MVQGLGRGEPGCSVVSLEELRSATDEELLAHAIELIPLCTFARISNMLIALCERIEQPDFKTRQVESHMHEYHNCQWPDEGCENQ